MQRDITLQEFNSHLAEALGTESVDWLKYYLEEVDPISEMHDLLAWVADNYHVGLLTNIMPGSLQAMMQQHLLPDIEYAAIIDSSEVGAIKPEEKIYQIATEKSNYQPDEILLVDDSRSNVMAAEKFGWKVLWFDHFHPNESIVRIKKILEFKVTLSLPTQ